LRVHYRDGGEALLPIRTQREVPGMTGHDEPTPVVWVRGVFLTLIGLSRQELTSNPRLPNPHPERLVASIDLEAATLGWANPMFFAVTAEPVTTSGNDGTKDTEDNASAEAQTRSPTVSSPTH